MHPISEYIGMKYAHGGRGPIFFDCWGLLCAFYKEKKGIELPSFPGIKNENSSEFGSELAFLLLSSKCRRILKPIDECAVAMIRSDGFVHHVGIYAAGMIVHCQEGVGVIADTTRALRLKGFREFKYYLYGMDH